MNLKIPKRFCKLDNFHLKLIAIITMLIDHSALVLLYWSVLAPNAPLTEGSVLYNLYTLYRIMRAIGRIAFPIFCFLIVQGFRHTSSRPRYGIRLAVFALISEIPFDLAVTQKLWNWDKQNVFFTLLFGLAALCCISFFIGRIKLARERKEPQGNVFLYLAGIPISAAVFMALAIVLRTDYSWAGVLLIVLMFLFSQENVAQLIAGSAVLLTLGRAEIPGLLAFIPINLYSGKRGKKIKYFFYLFYPAHLLILYLIEWIFFK